MGFHTFDPDLADKLEDESRYRWLSAEELRSLLALPGGATVADLGSGTGFFTDVVAPLAERVYAVDVQPEMHDLYREKGLPETVEQVEAPIEDLPFDDDALDAALSTMTYHEFAGEPAMAELSRVLRPGGHIVVVDWSRHGNEADGPPLSERHGLGHAVTAFSDAGFTVDHAVTRSETFICVARLTR